MPKLVQIPSQFLIDSKSVVLSSEASDAQTENQALQSIIEKTINLTQKMEQVCELVSARTDKTAFNLDIDDFDGPIDLLLHLVKRNELPIEKLSLAKVADQFLNCVKAAEISDLEVAGEYLVIAANLLSIKASLLVDPKAQIELESEDGPDPHAELLQRLREAAIYQQAAQAISARNILGVDVFAASIKDSLSKTPAPSEEPLAQHDLSLIFKAWNRVLQKMPVQKPQLVINWTRVSVTEKMQIFVDKLSSNPQKKFLFEELVESLEDLSHLVSSFVAILELCKRQLVFIAQDNFQHEIYISYRVASQACAQDATGFRLDKSEFDYAQDESADSQEISRNADQKSIGNI